MQPSVRSLVLATALLSALAGSGVTALVSGSSVRAAASVQARIWTSVPAAFTPTLATRWEYLAVRPGRDELLLFRPNGVEAVKEKGGNGPDAVSRIFLALGEEGWEYVGFVGFSGDLMDRAHLFKRPKAQPSS